MQYKGKLYGKWHNAYVELEGTSEQFDSLQELAKAVKAMRDAQKAHKNYKHPKTIANKRKTEQEVDKLLKNLPTVQEDNNTLF